MEFPPEVLFHRYFQQPCWQPLRDPAGNTVDVYRGKDSLEQLEPRELGRLLLAIQNAANEMLNQADYGPQHATRPPFHFDYIDCPTHRAAWAFRSDGVAFIGVTIPMMYRIWDLSDRLSYRNLLAQWDAEACDQEEWRQRLRTTFFRTAFRFVALHEWTHHIHGHVPQDGKAFAEISGEGSFERQVSELDADAIAAEHTIENLYDHDWALNILQITAAPKAVQDELLSASFVVGTGAVLFQLSHGPAFDSSKILDYEHPPHVARMMSIMHVANLWRARRMPDAQWISAERFRELMDGVAVAACETNPSAWEEQKLFLVSEAGLAYLNRLDAAFTAYKQALRQSQVKAAHSQG